jgi:hypothetical protein
MNNLICWICNNERVFQTYPGDDLLSEAGDKPCYQCYLEDKEAKEHEEDSECQ